jgi:hypothetical protein
LNFTYLEVTYRKTTYNISVLFASSITSLDVSHLNKSSCIQLTAIAHSAADVIACINLFEAVVISQAAKIHFILVSCLELTIKYQEASFSGSNQSIT